MIKIPYDYQEKAVNSIFEYFYGGGKGNPLIVAPTGSGKSVMIAETCRVINERWETQKVLILSHDSEILRQNLKAINCQLEDSLEIGLFSSELKSKTIKKFTVAGIQSIYRKPELFKEFNIIFLDEAHTVNYDKNSMYRKFFEIIKRPVIGFTATPFRMGTGYLHLGKDAFFDKIIFSIPLKTLQKRKKLCQVSSKQPSVTLDTSSISKTSKGEFISKELSLAFDRKRITSDIVDNVLQYLKKNNEVRKKWLVYAIDIKHAENIKECLEERGIKTLILHNKIKVDRNELFRQFIEDGFQAIVSVAMLTTGVDIPEVDLLVLMRPTNSAGLHVQIIGRGMRWSDLKKNCLVLDYAGNLERNGPIDKPIIERKRQGKGGGEPMTKICGHCAEIVAIATRICPCCGEKFLFKHHLNANASEANILASTNWHKVTEVKYRLYTNPSSRKTMMMVHYICGIRIFKQPVCFEHGGYPTVLARRWWQRRISLSVPETSSEAVQLSSQLDVPTDILVDESGKYDKFVDMKFKQMEK